MKLIINCEKIRTEVGIKLFNDIIERIDERSLQNYVTCKIIQDKELPKGAD